MHKQKDQLIAFTTSDGITHSINKSLFDSFPNSYFAALVRVNQYTEFDIECDNLIFMMILDFYRSKIWENVFAFRMSSITFEQLCDYLLLPQQPMRQSYLEKYCVCSCCKQRTTLFALMPEDIQKIIGSYLNNQESKLLCQQCEFINKIKLRSYFRHNIDSIEYDPCNDDPYNIIKYASYNIIEIIENPNDGMVCLNKHQFIGNRVFVWLKLFENNQSLLNNFQLVNDNKAVVFEIYYYYEEEKIDRIIDFLEKLNIVFSKEVDDNNQEYEIDPYIDEGEPDYNQSYIARKEKEDINNLQEIITENYYELIHGYDDVDGLRLDDLHRNRLIQGIKMSQQKLAHY